MCSKKERPTLAKLLVYIQLGDTIIVWKLDRIGRSFPPLFINSRTPLLNFLKKGVPSITHGIISF
ncbi:recombinase family protein [Paenibacillus sp. VTT E-133291]|uniref:recombinase family protein n=1 Tax=unclassified Paenibacillus TaxID=185978 RepID=UPI003593BB1A